MAKKSVTADDSMTRKALQAIAAEMESRPGIVVARDLNGIPRHIYRECSIVMDRLLAIGWITEDHHRAGKRLEDAANAFSGQCRARTTGYHDRDPNHHGNGFMETLDVRVMRAMGTLRPMVYLALESYNPAAPQHARFGRGEWERFFDVLDRHMHWIGKALAEELKDERDRA